jgi:hypothetical protein
MASPATGRGVAKPDINHEGHEEHEGGQRHLPAKGAKSPTRRSGRYGDREGGNAKKSQDNVHHYSTTKRLCMKTKRKDQNLPYVSWRFVVSPVISVVLVVSQW